MNVTIQQVGPDVKVPLNEFDGKVTYGEKRLAIGKWYCFSLRCSARSISEYLNPIGSDYENHVQQMAPVVAELAALESKAQMTFMKMHIAGR